MDDDAQQPEDQQQDPPHQQEQQEQQEPIQYGQPQPQQQGLTGEERSAFSDSAVVVQLAHEMAEAFDVAAVVANELSEIDGVIEQNLTQIDEFQVLLGTIHSERVAAATELVPLLVAHTKELEALYKQIDHLEGVVAFIRKNVDTAQQRIDETENAYKKNPLTNLISSIRVPFMKRQSRPRSIIPNMPEFHPIDIFNTEELFLTNNH